MQQACKLGFIGKAQGGAVSPRTSCNGTKMSSEWLPFRRSGMGVSGHFCLVGGARLSESLLAIGLEVHRNNLAIER